MSYIFEALKKLEQKRQREKVSRLLLVTEDSGPERRRWPFWTFSILSLLLLLNAMLMFWWTRPWNPHTPPPVTPAQTVSSTPAGSADKEQEQSLPATLKEAPRAESVSGTTAPVPEKKASHPSQPSRDTPKITSAEANTGHETRPPLGNRILDVRELPPAIRSSLPELKISAHFYADDPQSRFTRINEMNLREGQSFTGGITLEKITPEGVVLSYQGYRFQLGIK